MKHTPDLEKLGFTPIEIAELTELRTPGEIQDFVSAIPHNFERRGPTCRSAKGVLRARRAHCIEAAFVAALALWVQGEKPLVLDMQATADDYDHVIAVFRRESGWGAISKANHNYLRYRDPVYRTIRELVMSYFHEYYGDNGEKSLRAFSKPIDLRRLDPKVWAGGDADCWDIALKLDGAPHEKVFRDGDVPDLRPLDDTELAAGAVAQWKK